MTPLQASILGIPDSTFALTPTFIPGSLTVLWGRGDFMRAWDFRFSEVDEIFMFTPR